MNYVNFIVKILEKPKQTVFNNEICVTRFIAESSKIENQKMETMFNIAVWGKYSDDISKYFFVDDYIIIEGYISLSNIPLSDKNSFVNKQIEISAFKVYPFLFY